jgi:hypothetical protein
LAKQTWFVPDLAPDVDVLATDEDRRSHVRAALSPTAADLLDAVEQGEGVSMASSDWPTKEGRTARLSLERLLLVWTEQLHTDRGSHEAVVRPWSTSPIARAAAPPGRTKRPTFTEAADRLLDAALLSAVVAPQKEASGWFAFLVESPLAKAIDEGRVRLLTTSPPSIVPARPGD